MKIVAIVQARMGSTRMPGKVMQLLAGVPAIELLLMRLERSKLIDEICVATSLNIENDKLHTLIDKLGYRVVRGSEEDVLDRFWTAANATEAEVIVRITGDCPVIDPVLVDRVVDLFLKSSADYVSNVDPPTFPDGLDVEVFSKKSLEYAQLVAKSSHDREHVTPFIRNGNFERSNLKNSHDTSHLRLTLDEPNDLNLLQKIFEQFHPDRHFNFEKIVEYLTEHPELISVNSAVKRNEGAKMNKNQKLYSRAKNVILGGTSLLSKRPEMFLPDNWPVYFKKTSGVKIWDLDGVEYIDMGLMGVGTNTLGYSHPEVDQAVRGVIDNGNLSSLNCFEEVELAEKLITLNPWASKVRYARTGGEANALAVRIARSAARSSKIAVCGYHGWHDWYLAANLGTTEGLDGHLMPGLEPRGVPRDLNGSIFTFDYNDLGGLEALIQEERIGIIKMEVMRNQEPQDGFLKKVRSIADKNNIILIFDECSSGFREVYGGLFNKYDVTPDIAIFGKTLGNGYAITAVVGKEDVMQCAQTSFISSTFWTERIGPVAALKSLEIMEREESWKIITDIGNKYRERLNEICESIGVKLEVSGLPALTTYAVTEKYKLQAKTYITQELLKSGILATTAFYPSVMHKQEHFDKFFGSLLPILESVARVENSKIGFNELLDGPVCHGGFKRLN